MWLQQRIYPMSLIYVKDKEVSSLQQIQMENIDHYLPNTYDPYSYHTDPYSDDYKKDLLRSETDTLNAKMVSSGLPPMGNLFSSSVDQVEKTLECVRRLLTYRHKEMETRSELVNKLRRLENQKDSLQVSNEKLSKDKSSLECEKEQLKQKLKMMEKYFKEETDKLMTEKKEVQKDLLAIQNRENQFNNDYRKKDQKIQEYEEKFKKFVLEKQPPKNSFEAVAALEQNGPSVYYLNADHEYSQMIQKNSQQMYERLTHQNLHLKECLGNIYRELQDILELRKEMLVRRKQMDNENFDLNGINLSTFKIDLLNMPLENSREAIELLDDNLKRFKEQMDRLDIIGSDDKSDQDVDKIRTLKSVKGLIKNYKHIVETQDQLLSKVIVKAKDLRMSEMKGAENRFSKCLEEDEMKNARRFIEDQKMYLQSKDKELEVTRKAVSLGIKRVEEEKNEMIRRRKEIEEEGNKLKRQIQLLPCIIDS